MPASVRVVDPDEIPEWDRLLEPFPDSTFFHTREWAAILRSTYGFRPRYLLLGTPAAPQGLLPLMQVDSWLTGRRGIALPFSDACSPLSQSDGDLHELLAEARRLAGEAAWKYLEIRGGLERIEGVRPSTTFFGHVLPLVENEDFLFRQLDPSARRAIRKANTDDVVVETHHSEAALGEFCHLLALTRKGHGVPQQPPAFFRNLHRTMISQGKGCIVMARLNRVAIAAAMFLEHKRKVLYKFGGSDVRHLKHRGNNLVMWKAITEYARRGFETFDFGRTSLANEGLRRFKLGWGSGERPISYFRYDCRCSDWATVADRSTNRLTPIFQKLPVGLSRAVGRMLYRHVA